MTLAIIDATHHSRGEPPGMTVAGLSLLERSLRLADVVGCTRAAVLTRAHVSQEAREVIETTDADLEITLTTIRAESILSVLDEATSALPSTDDGEATLYLRSSTVYRRQLVSRCLKAVSREGADNESADQEDADGDGERPDVATAVARRRDEEGAPPLLAFVDRANRAVLAAAKDTQSRDIQPLVATLRERETDLKIVEVREARGWAIDVTHARAVWHAEDRLWDDCRKPVDGIISRNFNRNVSLAVSRRIAPFDISPNQISLLTFLFGIAAAVSAAVGGFWPFLVAGLLYQVNAIADGIDGEIARVKYEFSVLGEWMDTVTDDLKDVLFYAGLGWGAWQTGVPSLADLGPRLWLWLGAAAVGGKVLSMLGYYTYLIARGRGDMYAFQWSFESDDDEGAEPSRIATLLSKLKYLTKDDFAVFLAMCLGLAGLLPWFLVFAAVGQVVVAVSVFIQRLTSFD